MSSISAKTISKNSIRDEAEQIGSFWFSGLVDELEAMTPLQEQILQSYSENFHRLIKISAPNNLKSSYDEVLKILQRNYVMT